MSRSGRMSICSDQVTFETKTDRSVVRFFVDAKLSSDKRSTYDSQLPSDLPVRRRSRHDRKGNEARQSLIEKSSMARMATAEESSPTIDELVLDGDGYIDHWLTNG
jgi:hypothetical protein